MFIHSFSLETTIAFDCTIQSKLSILQLVELLLRNNANTQVLFLLEWGGGRESIANIKAPVQIREK